MGTLDDLGQKIKGKTQQLEGELEQQSGRGVKGGIAKIKGKFNETMADAKLRSRRRTRRNTW